MKKLSIKGLKEKRKAKGFTLIELIIVIAIIAILAAMAIPKFGEIKETANKKTELATAKNIATAAATLIADGKEVNDSDVNDTSDVGKKLDGSITPKVKGHTGFYLKVEDGNISVYYEDKTTKVYPEK